MIMLYPLGYLLPLLLLVHFIATYLKHKNIRGKLPPGPISWPVWGNLHQLGILPHRSLHTLAKKHGDIMLLKLGQIPTVVVSSSHAAELFLKTHDTVFATRPKGEVGKILSYGAKGIGFTEYGSYWRDMRKFSILHLLSSRKVESWGFVRKEKILAMADSLRPSAENSETVDICQIIRDVLHDVMCQMLFGRTSRNDVNLQQLIRESIVLAGSFNIGDFVPFTRKLDLQGLRKRMKAFNRTMDGILEKIIDQHIQDPPHKNDEQPDFVDELLHLYQDHQLERDTRYKFDRINIKAIMIDMIVASIDTTSTTCEWVLSELMRHPEIMRHLQKELETRVGSHRMVEEADLLELEYLDMVVKETLRLHPIVPLLLPRESMEDVTINGYHIPKRSRIIINAWAIGREEASWGNHRIQEFVPERFKSTNIDLRGNDFQLIPFGGGRRICPGMQLGLLNVKFILAQLLHCFDWELPLGMTPCEIDMNEQYGITICRASPLLLVPKLRLHV